MTSDQTLLEALKRGDEDAFITLVEAHQPSMVRIAMIYVGDRGTAEEVAQETWLAVLKGLDRFEGRSSLKTWIFSILKNRAITRAQRESRYLDFDLEESDDPAVPPERFHPADHQGPGDAHHWAHDPSNWESVPEQHLLSQETLGVIRQAIDALPVRQREVITLRDIEGWNAEEVVMFLGISETNQRVLLHRARSKVRAALEQYLKE
jgi:RNA polymerase sigma-70 factor (ECF subfamily)